MKLHSAELDERIILELAAKSSLDLDALAVAVGESIATVHAQLMTLCDEKRVHATPFGSFRLTNEQRTRMREQHGATPVAPPKVPRDGLPEPAVGDRQTTAKATQVTAKSHESDDLQPGPNLTNLADSSPADESAPSDPNRTQRLAGIPEPTDAELDALEATEQDTCSDCELFERCREPDRSADSPVLYADGQPRCAWFSRAENSDKSQSHVWGVAHNRPTKGLRIERVVEEFLAVEKRRQELLEELRRLVG